MLTIVDEDIVELSTFKPISGASLLVSALPSCQPANFRPASAPMTDVLAERKQSESVLHAVVEQVSTEVTTLRKVSAITATAKGQLYVAARTPTGRRHACAVPVNYIDPEPGRILFYTSNSKAGEYFTALPGTPDAISEHLERLRAGLVD